MSEPVLIAIILAMQAILVALIARTDVRLTKIKRATEATKDQIVNHHPEQPNMREENDSRHEETKRWFSTVFNRLVNFERRVNNKLEKVEKDVNDLMEGFLENRDRIEDLEDTKEQ